MVKRISLPTQRIKFPNPTTKSKIQKNKLPYKQVLNHGVNSKARHKTRTSIHNSKIRKAPKECELVYDGNIPKIVRERVYPILYSSWLRKFFNSPIVLS